MNKYRKYQEKQNLKRTIERTEKKLSYTRAPKKRVQLISRINILTEFYEEQFGEVEKEKIKVEEYDLIGGIE